MEQLKFFRTGESAIYPTRGTKQSAGIDFYIPNPSFFNDSLISFIEAKLEESENISDIKNSYMKNGRIDKYFWHLVLLYNRLFFIKKNDEIWTDGRLFLPANCNIVIPTGITTNIPHGKCLTFFNKSGIATKKSLIVGAQVIDEDYTGIVHIDLHNVGGNYQIIECGQKIAQAIIMDTHIDDVELVNCEGENDKGVTERGSGGFGSTGK